MIKNIHSARTNMSKLNVPKTIAIIEVHLKKLCPVSFTCYFQFSFTY